MIWAGQGLNWDSAWGVDIAKSINIPEADAIGLIKTSVFFLGVFSVIGSFIGGPLSDKLGRKTVFAIGFIGEVLITFYAAYVHNLFGVVAVSLIGGLAGGMLVPLWAPYVGDIFGRASLGSLFGLLTFAAGLIGGTGPVIFGRIFDKAGSYGYAFIFAATCYFIALVLISLVKRQK